MGLGVPLGFFEKSRKLFFFRLKCSNGFPVETPVPGRSFIFCTLFVSMGLYFAPARGSPVSVSEHVMASQVYIKVEHIRI